jgi:hypothetical protein
MPWPGCRRRRRRSSLDGDCDQVHHEHRKTDRQGSRDLQLQDDHPLKQLYVSLYIYTLCSLQKTSNFGAAARVALGNGSRKDGVHEHGRAHDLGGEPRDPAVPVAHGLLAAAEPREGVRRVGRPDEACTADGSGAEALRGNVERGAGQRECETFRARSSGSANVTAARRIDVPAYDHAHAQHGTRQRPVTVTGLDRPKFVVGRAGIKLQSYVSSLPEQGGIFYVGVLFDNFAKLVITPVRYKYNTV